MLTGTLEHLGSGHSGNVNLVKAKESKKKSMWYKKCLEYTAAYKTAIKINGKSLDSAIQSLKTEIKALLRIGNHPFIVKMLMSNDDPKQGTKYVSVLLTIELYDVHYIRSNYIGDVGLLLEHCPLGSILDYIKPGISNQPAETAGTSGYESTMRYTGNDGLKWCFQIAKAVAHISALRVVHRDIAARNILLDTNLNVKLSDFGLAIFPDEECSQPKYPVSLASRWMAYESLTERVFSFKSDVWSCGVAFWEIFSEGRLFIYSHNNISK